MNGLGFIDKYGEGMGFEIEGKGAYPSIIGVIVSLVVNVIVLAYFYKQFKVTC